MWCKCQGKVSNGTFYLATSSLQRRLLLVQLQWSNGLSAPAPAASPAASLPRQPVWCTSQPRWHLSGHLAWGEVEGDAPSLKGAVTSRAASRARSCSLQCVKAFALTVEWSGSHHRIFALFCELLGLKTAWIRKRFCKAVMRGQFQCFKPAARALHCSKLSKHLMFHLQGFSHPPTHPPPLPFFKIFSY